MRWISYLFSIIFLFFLTHHSPLITHNSYAIYDPSSVPNNKFGIHIISVSPDESSPAALLVNSNGGDWGYITLLIESKDRNKQKWQEMFNDLRKRHLIPLVRIATQPEGGYWKRPYEGEEQAWADFLDELAWPTKNRYVIIYNEPNHATEWGNSVDASHYAQILDKTIDALRKKNEDFFVLNAGFDASAPQKLPAYQDQLDFMQKMNEAVPGIFNKLDGWVSHSYPNPGFVGDPSDTGRGTVRTWVWETQTLKELGVSKDLPIFIAETGWKHSNGYLRTGLPKPETLSTYYKSAFESAWNSNQIVAVTPFLLNYQDAAFANFSFKKHSSNQNPKDSESFHPFYYALQALPKVTAKPIQENKATLTKGEIYRSLVALETYSIALSFKNIGQSIWNEYDPVRLVITSDSKDLQVNTISIPQDLKVEPGQDYTFNVIINTPSKGTYNLKLNLFEGDKEFESKPLEYKVEVKSPVVLKVNAKLKWKDRSGGEYILGIVGAIGERLTKIVLGENGSSEEFESRYLIPDKEFDFTLKKPFYKEKTIHKKVISGVNILDFGELQPDIPSAILNPRQLWKLLPISN